MQLPVIHDQPDDGLAPRADVRASPGLSVGGLEGAGAAVRRLNDALAALPAGAGEEAAAQAVVIWATRRFAGRRLVVVTGFGMEGCVLIDMLWRTGVPLNVHYLDTHFLFAQTHALRARLEARYPEVTFVNAGTALTPAEQEVRFGPRLWEREPDRCCGLRKVEPMRALLHGADAWMTAIRRGQSASRSSIARVEWDSEYELVKVCPLAMLSREQVWDYAVANGVPYNELHEQGYPSIGCTHCTRPVAGAGVTDYSRSGRWAGTGKTECGLHGNTRGGGI